MDDNDPGHDWGGCLVSLLVALAVTAVGIVGGWLLILHLLSKPWRPGQ